MNQDDRTRLEEFRQFRKEIRGSKEYLLVSQPIPSRRSIPRLLLSSLDTSSRIFVHQSMSVYTPLSSLESKNLNRYPKKDK